MQLSPALHLVDGIGNMVNVYLWERPDGGLTLIDTGMPSAAKGILDFVGSLGLERLDRIIITHADMDHCGGLSKIKAATGARVICHAVEKPYVERTKPRELPRSLPGRLLAPVLRLASNIVLGGGSPIAVDELVLDNDTLIEGLQVVHVPGHSPGQIALYEANGGILIAADALFNRGDRLSRPMPLATAHMQAAEDSVRKLAALRNLDLICCGHGPPIAHNAAQRLKALADSL